MTSADSGPPLDRPAADPGHWLLDPAVVFLNHGSFGSCPRPVLEFQQRLRNRLERQPVRFLVRELEPLWDQAREVLSSFLGAATDDLVFVPNATTGVNTVLRSLPLRAGDELVVVNHEYNACRNALNVLAERTGARVIEASIPFPLKTATDCFGPVIEKLSPRTRLVLLDHVTSQTGLILPLESLLRELNRRGVESLIDGAHAPGMTPLNLSELGATYYTGNCHKWICAPKGAAFLWVRRDRQEHVRPLIISHGANSPRTDRSRFLIEFAWTGTSDPSSLLSVPEALRFMGSLLPGGWPQVMRRNRELALAARRLLCDALEITPPCPDEFIGSLASLPISDATSTSVSKSPLYLSPLQDRLLDDYGIEVPIIPWPAPSKRVLRISAQVYNSLPQYEHLARALREVL